MQKLVEREHKKIDEETGKEGKKSSKTEAKKGGGGASAKQLPREKSTK